MKKLLLGLAFLSVWQADSNAQIGSGGLPASVMANMPAAYVPVTKAELPDWNSAVKEWEAKPDPKPYIIAAITPADLAFPQSGILYTTADGTQVWRARMQVSGAKALGFYYDRFHLPKGVRFYLTNASGSQVLGAYTEANNDPGNKFVNEAVQGDIVNLELNIDPGVNLSDIQLHIDRAAAYSRGIEYLAAYAPVDGDLQTIDEVDTALTGASSVCMINAICPTANNYAAQRDAAFQWIIAVGQGVGVCSATMLNNTGNAPGNCKQYFLLASHCDGNNSTTSSAFDQVLLRYNFQHATCQPAANAVPNNTHTATRANFVARSVIPSNVNSIKGDFLLMEPRNTIPASWGVNLAGWNNAANISQTQTNPKKFIGFHHPGGDSKKVSASQQIQSESLGAAGTHWLTIFTEGLGAEGSSGSALFDGDGRVIGIASVAAVGQGVNGSCGLNARGEDISDFTSNLVMYSKLSYDWDYTQDGSASIRKLKPWLDPANTGAVTINTVKSDCTPLSGSTAIITTGNKLDEAVSVYPVPTTTGKVTVRVNLAEAGDLSLELFDISGRRVNSYGIPKAASGSYTLDLSKYSNGMYLLKISDGYNTASRKIMISR